MSIPEQTNELVSYFLRNINYIDEEAFLAAKNKLLDANDIDALTDDEWLTIIMRGSHVGDVMRIAYYRYVYRRGYDPDAYWHAIIKGLLLGGVFMPWMDAALKDRRVKSLIKRTRYPRWTVYGLIGGNRADIQRDAKKFCAYMDELEAKYEKEAVSNR